MAEFYDGIKSVAVWLFTALIGVLIWFFKGIYSDFKEMQSFYTKHREIELSKIMAEIESLKRELQKVELESKRYWNDHKTQMENNQKILLERINHNNDNTKASTQMLVDCLERVEKRMDRIETRLNEK